MVERWVAPTTSEQLNRKLLDAFDGGIELHNQRGQIVDFEVTGSEQRLAHSLNTIPVGFYTLLVEEGCVISAVRPKEWTKSHVMLKGSVPQTQARVFLIGG